MKSLKTILRFGDSDYAVKSIRSKRRKKSSNVPRRWREGGYRISHQSIGGVTNGIFKFDWAVRIENPDVPFSPPPTVHARLSQVLCQTDSSGKEVGEPNDGEPNSFHGILNWKCRNDLVTAKHVFGENKWVQRHLSIKEKAESLDFPNTRTAIMTEELIHLLTKSEVPGKIMVGSLWYLNHDERNQDHGKSGSRKRGLIICELGSVSSPKRRKRKLQTKKNEADWGGSEPRRPKIFRFRFLQLNDASPLNFLRVSYFVIILILIFLSTFQIKNTRVISN